MSDTDARALIIAEGRQVIALPPTLTHVLVSSLEWPEVSGGFRPVGELQAPSLHFSARRYSPMIRYPGNVRPLICPQVTRSHGVRGVAEVIRLRPRCHWSYVRNAIVTTAAAVTFWIVIFPAIAMVLHWLYQAGGVAFGRIWR